MTLADDTIAAIATAAGAGGVGIIRLSGPRAIEIAAAALGIAPDALDRKVRVGWVRDASGELRPAVRMCQLGDAVELDGAHSRIPLADGGHERLARRWPRVLEGHELEQAMNRVSELGRGEPRGVVPRHGA